jgi:ectoine hydroxylase-related dioxygenase (phytanoyl-CoA dioxygenase family)
LTLEDYKSEIVDQGFAVLPNLVTLADVSGVLDALSTPLSLRSRVGIRHALSNPAVSRLARDPSLLQIANRVVGSGAFPFRATLFDKSPVSNWLVVWHQDTAWPLRQKIEADGWGPWSVKAGIIYAHAPASALDQVLALRLHLDDSTKQNGPLRVLPGTHTLGVLSDEAIHQLAEKIPPHECEVPRGGILAMRPLIVHASSKSQSSAMRRVLHIEYAASAITSGGIELAIP